MHSFEQLSERFTHEFLGLNFPEEPSSLYQPNAYFLKLGGKRVRPVLCLMGNELFEEIIPDAWHAANAIELFHNFTLIHDDIMDNAPLRRGMQTIHALYGANTAMLSGDVMLVHAYENLNKVSGPILQPILQVFNNTARKVCEGQQMDMDFEKTDQVNLEAYIKMIELKTSVLLAGSLKIGAILGGAGKRNQNLLYEFGKKLGIAFQIQDDYLDAFGDPEKFGKKQGGDILANKKTFLMIHAWQTASDMQLNTLKNLQNLDEAEKINTVLEIFKTCKVDEWALQLKNKYLDDALSHLEDTAVLSKRKEPLFQLAQFLVKREY